MSAIPSWAHVGAKMVCVCSDWTEAERQLYSNVAFPAENGVYTIREVTATYTPGEIGVRLVEISNPVILWADGVGEPAFAVERFRPLITIEDDIATHFSALLNVREPEGV